MAGEEKALLLRELGVEKVTLYRSAGISSLSDC